MFSLESSGYKVKEYLIHSCNCKYNLFILWCRIIALLVDKNIIVSSNT